METVGLRELRQNGVLDGPPDPDWDEDRDLIDDEIADPWARR